MATADRLPVTEQSRPASSSVATDQEPPMARTKSRTSSAKKSRAPRATSVRSSSSRLEGDVLRRYLEFVRTVLGPTRNGR